MVKYETKSFGFGYGIGLITIGFCQILMDNSPLGWDLPISFGLSTFIAGIIIFVIAYWKLKSSEEEYPPTIIEH